MENTFYDLTNAQKSIWNTELFFNGSNINNICGTICLDEPLDFKDLQKALKLIIAENDNFRTQFTIKDGSIYQSFLDKVDYDVEIVDINTKEDLKKLENTIISRIFDILNSNLFDIKIFRYPDLTGGVIVNIHHLISDSWTLGLVAKDIVTKYTIVHNKLSNTPNTNSYINYINSEQKYIASSKFVKDKEFWLNYLKNRPDCISIPSFSDIPTNTKDLGFKGVRKVFNLDDKIVCKINDFCKAYNVSMYNFLMAIYSVYIGRINKSEDFILGTPILNRTSSVQKNTMGMFINTVPVRVKPTEHISFLAFVNNIALNFTSIYRHQKHSYQYILEELRKEDPTTPNLYQVLLSYQITKTTTNDSMKYSCDWNFTGAVADDIDIHFFDLNDSGSLNIAYDYKVCKYTEKDIENIHNRILYMIEQVLLNPGISLSEISIATPKELKEILNLAAKNDCAYPSNKTISQLFEDQVNLTPDNIAIKFKDSFLTYKELNEKANQVAIFLRKLGVQPNDVVALRLNKSLEMVVGILGILKAGGCYLPIDLSYPQERVSFMLKDSLAKLFLTNKSHEKDLEIPIDTYVLDINSRNEIYKNPTDNLDCVNSPDDLIYIIYTSGSTGTPKGVMLKHRNVVRLIKNENFQFDFNENDVWTMFHSVAFDFSVWELYGSLLYGSKLILVPELTAKDPNKFLQLLRDEKVSVLNQTPTYFYNLLDRELLNENNDLVVRYIIYGGEALKPNLVKPWKDKYPFTKIINMYGITETTVHVTFKELSNEDLLSSNSNIGKPIPTLKVFVMDKNLHILPYGVEGEMCVSGLGVCKGYLNRPELNKDRFVPNPYNPNEILYRSADDAYLTPDGDLHYLGRIDNQVKIRGFRVETGEIETKLLRHQNIQKCVVLPKKNGDFDSYLVAYVVMNEKQPISELKDYISKLVPSYMVPNYFVFLDNLPLTSNGKVDRKKLLSMDVKIEKKKKYEAPRNEFEETFQDILQHTLNIKQIGIDDNILELGADSLTLMRVTIELLEKNFIVNIQDIYEFKTIREISDNFYYPKKSNLYKRTIANNVYFKFRDNFSSKKIKANNILLTGSTGYLGIHILNELITNTNANVYCVIRNKNHKSPEERLSEKLSFYFGNKLLKHLHKRIFVLTADITVPQFGLSDEEYSKLGNTIDMVIHSAAYVSHYGDEHLFELINVTGTNNIIDFCSNFSIYLNHISTTSVSASIPDSEKPVVFDEHCLYVGQNYSDNIYIKTKFEAEYNIWEALQNSNLKASVYRLGNISARYSDGKFQENDDKNAFLNRVLTVAKLDKIAKSFSNLKIDLSPVDYCAKIIVRLCVLSSSYSKVFHIYHNKSLKFIDLINKIKPKHETISEVSDDEFYKYIKNKGDILGIINDLTSNSSTYNSNIEMKNKFTINYMKNVDLSWPEINTKYINNFFTKFLTKGD